MPKKNGSPKLSSKRAPGAARPAGKPVSASRTEMVEAVLPNDANVLGNILGGRVMHLIDIAGAIAALRHSKSPVVTASVDYIDFRNPIKVGDLILLEAEVNRAFHTSIEVGVEVFSENVLTAKRTHTSSAFVTYVAIDRNGRPRPVPPVLVRTPAERRRYREAGIRRRIRLAHRYGRGLAAEAARLEKGAKSERGKSKRKGVSYSPPVA
ncbi:MAG TPA: acyl-CoA thioesterase [Patescibacteria group bacterium]|nr:acyl-CoA thioesterase [Patescibacteria group bacterium]